MMEELGKQILTILTNAGSRLLLALLVFLIGRVVIGKIMDILKKLKVTESLDPTICSFMLNFTKTALYVLLGISVVGILGVPMASVVALLASAGIAVGMSLQGALSNLAGGIMLLVFRPFNVGDYVITAGVEGTVQTMSLFYTFLQTADNKKVTVPNGTLMSANVTNCSSDDIEKMDLVFSCAKGEDIAKIKGILLDVVIADDYVLRNPEPSIRLSAGTDDTMEFTARVWCRSEDFANAFDALTKDGTSALTAAGIKTSGAVIKSESLNESA